MTKYYSFRHIIEEIHVLFLIQESMKMISKKQLKLFNYLYIEEDISTLAAYEVYLLTGDINDLVESLLLIDKLNFFSNKLVYSLKKDFDEIEQFDENMEEQFDIIYTFKKHLSLDLRQTLEKFIRIGDKSLIDMYSQYKQHKDKERFLNDLKKFAHETSGKLQKIEKQIQEQKVEEEKLNRVDDRKDMLRRFQTQKFLPEVEYMELLDHVFKDYSVD